MKFNRANKKPPYWLLIAAVPVIHAFLYAVRSFALSTIRGRTDWSDVVFNFFDWLVLSLLVPLIYVLARRHPLRREKFSRVATAHLVGCVTFTLVWTGFGVLLGWLLDHFPGDENLLVGYKEWLFVTTPWSIFVYALMLGCLYAFTYYNEARDRESQQAKLAAQLSEARLSALRMQLNPHFLFNSLNAITVLVRHQRNDIASQMLEELSDILRHVLRSNPQGETTLNEEIAFLQKYLAIEQVRFSDRLKVKWAINPDVGEALVPEFILQPLVENAVRHGIAARADDGVIEISATEVQGNLVLTVRDNGPGYQPAIEAGLGLSNTRERVATLYGDSGAVEILNAPDGGTVATVHFPFKNR